MFLYFGGRIKLGKPRKNHEINRVRIKTFENITNLSRERKKNQGKKRNNKLLVKKKEGSTQFVQRLSSLHQVKSESIC